MNKIVINTIRWLIEMLAMEKYADVYELDREKQLSVQLIKNAIMEYGGHVTVPPCPFPLINIYRQAESPNALFTDIRLWIDDEESDLTLQCTLFNDEVYNERYTFAITDILVM